MEVLRIGSLQVFGVTGLDQVLNFLTQPRPSVWEVKEATKSYGN